MVAAICSIVVSIVTMAPHNQNIWPIPGVTVNNQEHLKCVVFVDDTSEIICSDGFIAES